MEVVKPGVRTPGPESPPSPAPEDAADVALAAAGDRRAFERLYHRHSARVFSLAVRMVGPAEATEVTQDVFLRTWNKLSTFRGESRFTTWLHRLAVNVMLGKRAAFAKNRARFLADDSVLEVTPARASGHELGMDFETAIARLPKGARAIFLLYDVEGYKHEEIAGMLDISTGTTKAQLHRARMLLRKALA